ncbi:MAG: glycosyltransferase [Elusimicrobia bacterium]|nr:glycosyltransferase [Elusimicrobiota bacterium]
MGKKIRVLHVTVGLNIGGTEKLLSRLAAAINPERFDVSVLCLKSWGIEAEYLRQHGLRVFALEGRGWWDVRLGFRLFRFFRHHSFEVVHSHLAIANVVAAIFKSKGRLVWHIHEMGEGTSWLFRKAERCLGARADVVLAVSKAVARAFSSRTGREDSRVRVFPNAIPSEKKGNPLKEKLPVPWPEPRQVIGFVGRLDDEIKGIRVLLQAAKRVVQKAPTARFLIVGDGPDRQVLEKTSETLGLKDFVSFTGEIPNAAGHFSEFDLFVLPSRFEGFGIGLLEAMWAGCPVVATRTGGIPEVILDGETGLLVPPEDPKALADALLLLLTDPEKRSAMGRKASSHIETHFRWEKFVEDTESIYENSFVP